ncbi:uncharacterized protein [Eurosta solidaginis]|uniref:uncharacterized protein isoform X2 n=1 Tax=Eurosta solidaginis TaxID=178769 RepID=UPI0035310A90
MADDPINQQLFAEDVAAYAAGDDYDYDIDNSDSNFEMASVDEVWQMIEEMDDISDEEKAELKESLYNPMKAAEHLVNHLDQTVHTSWDYMIFLLMIGLVMIVFALFGYKLYKSLKEKELKKQEKLKSKQAKKSKKTN